LKETNNTFMHADYVKMRIKEAKKAPKMNNLRKEIALKLTQGYNKSPLEYKLRLFK